MTRRRWALLVALALVSPCRRDRGPAHAVVVPTVPAPAPAPPPVVLPTDPYEGLCERRCDARPTDPPARLAPADPCPTGTCRRTIELRFSEELQVEIDGRIEERSFTLERWTGPLVFQVYSDFGRVDRCAVEITPDTDRLRVRRPDDDVVVEDPDAADRTICEHVVTRTAFDFGSVLHLEPAALDAALDDARAALSADRYADDDDVSVWLLQQRRLPFGARIARRTPESRSPDAVAFLPIDTSDLPYVLVDGRRYCTPWCFGSASFVGPLRARRSLGLYATGERRFCDRWAAIADRRFVALDEGRLATIFELPTVCTPSWSYVRDLARVPFDAPPERDPTPRPDPAAPSRIDPDDPWIVPTAPQASAEVPARFRGEVATLGSWFALVEPDPWLRLKAVHDWVATSIAYDVASLDPAKRAPQDAGTVFRTRKGVCAGYANLMVALGAAAGLEIVYVRGHSRDRWGAVGVEGHAWNAARVDGRWILLDATWDAGTVGEGGFVPRYSTRYLFAPPEVFAVDHHPADPAWQLLDPPVPTDTFGRRPGLAEGALVWPRESPATVVGPVLPVRVAAVEGATVGWRPRGGAEVTPCPSSGGLLVEAKCHPTGAGPWQVEIADADGRLLGTIEAILGR